MISLSNMLRLFRDEEWSVKGWKSLQQGSIQKEALEVIVKGWFSMVNAMHFFLTIFWIFFFA